MSALSPLSGHERDAIDPLSGHRPAHSIHLVTRVEAADANVLSSIYKK